MSFPNNEQWLFIVEWFDPQPQMKKQYLLKYFVESHMVEMVDVKSKKIFLKKSPCPPEIDAADFFIGGIIILYSRELNIVDFGDGYTRSKFAQTIQRVVAILSQYMSSSWGTAIGEIHQEFRLSRLKTYAFPPNVATAIVQSLEVDNRLARLLDGTCLVVVADGSSGYQKIADIASRYSTEMLITRNGTQTTDVIDAINAGHLPDTSTLDNCTCVVVKPHAVKSKSLGDIIQHILSQGYEISAIISRHLDRIQAEEFLEVYKGVLPDFNDHVTQLSSGLCVAMEVRAEQAVPTFRITAGPWDVEFAKQLRPQTIRGLHGIDKIRNAIHCTDLESDGSMECEYMLQLLEDRPLDRISA